MAIQVKLPDDPLRRRFNPDRDLAWILPRLMKRGLMTLGVLTEPKLRQVLAEAGLSDKRGIDDFKEFMVLLTDVLAAAMHPEENPREVVRGKLAELYKLPPAIRMLVFDRVMKVIMAEYVVWCEQVKPESEKDPRPDIAEIEEARDALLG